MTDDDEEEIYEVARLFIGEKQSAGEVAKSLGISRQKVYRLEREAVKRGFLRFVPRVSDRLQNELRRRYGIATDNLYVVDRSSDVPRKAAELVNEFIRARWTAAEHSFEKPIGLGLGPGKATRQFASDLAGLIDADPTRIHLHLFALTGGGPAEDPESSPISFFGLFGPQRKTALFAPSLVTAEEFERMKDHPGIKEAFHAKRDGRISIVATAMGEAPSDEELNSGNIRDLLSRSLRIQHEKELEKMLSKGYVANVQYRPIDGSGTPIPEEDEDYRAVTLFEIEDLRRMASNLYKYVILMARNKGAEAMRPLLEAPEGKRLFRTIVLDKATAVAIRDSWSH